MHHDIDIVHPTQTQYHHELRDTVIAQKGLISPDTIKSVGLISTVATHSRYVQTQHSYGL